MLAIGWCLRGNLHMGLERWSRSVVQRMPLWTRARVALCSGICGVPDGLRNKESSRKSHAWAFISFISLSTHTSLGTTDSVTIDFLEYIFFPSQPQHTPLLPSSMLATSLSHPHTKQETLLSPWNPVQSFTSCFEFWWASPESVCFCSWLCKRK